mmetsp:Transcript_1507/g.4866  ORF Transcript_1507/g.4866 Transcript_1507/m.4866 type:complete len:223 (-) Transcript_1507:1378-2046(-)
MALPGLYRAGHVPHGTVACTTDARVPPCAFPLWRSALVAAWSDPRGCCRSRRRELHAHAPPPHTHTSAARHGHLRRVHQRDVAGVVHLAPHEALERGAVGQLLLGELGADPLRHRLLDDVTRDRVAHLPDARDVGEGAPVGNLLRRHRVDARDGRGVEHPVGDLLHSRDRGGEADAGEDVHVVALGRDEGAPVGQRHGREGGAGGDDGAAVRPLVRLLRRAL